MPACVAVEVARLTEALVVVCPAHLYASGPLARVNDIVVATPDGVGFDLSAATGTGQITVQNDGSVLLALTVGTTGDGTRLLADGWLLVSATAAQTATLTAQLAEYAIRLTWADPYVVTVLTGDCTIRKVWTT